MPSNFPSTILRMKITFKKIGVSLSKGSFLGIVVLLSIVIIGCGKKNQESEMQVPANQEITESSINQEGTALESLPMEQQPVSENFRQAASMQAEMLQQQTSEQAGGFSKPSGRNVQQALKNVGLYEGNIDGAIGPVTRRAIEAFQSRNDLVVDGKVGPKTWQKLSPYLSSVSTSTSHDSSN